MAIVNVTDIGATNASSTDGFMEFFGNYPKGSLIFAAVYEQNTTGVPGTMTDLAGNSYTRLSSVSPNNDISQGVVSTYYSFNSSSVALCTYTLSSSSAKALGSGMWASGLLRSANPVDTPALPIPTTGNSSAPLNTTNILNTVGGELVMGVVGWPGLNTDTFTQDSTHGFSGIFNTKFGGACLGGGYQVRSGTTAPIIYSPQIDPSNFWGESIAIFKAAPQPTISVYSLGTFSDTPSATVTMSGINVPRGALIFLAAFERNSNGQVGTYSDTAGNTYRVINDTTPAGNAANGTVSARYAYNAKPLTNGTITYTKRTAGVATAISVFYATGILGTSNPLDVSIGNGDFGTSASQIINASGPLTNATELVVGVMGWVTGASNTFTQDKTESWSAPPDGFVNTGMGIGIGAGFYISQVTDTPSYTTFVSGAAKPYAILIQAFMAGGFPAPAPDDTTLGVNDA